MKRFVFFLWAFFPFWVMAQHGTPARSPFCTLKQTMGSATVELNYSRPGVKGREIFGALVPYNQLWRAGANGSTDVYCSEDMVVGGEILPAGHYGLYIIPRKGIPWELIFYSDPNLWGTGGSSFDSSKVVMRVPMKEEEHPFMENLQFDFQNIQSSNGLLTMCWEKVRISVPWRMSMPLENPINAIHPDSIRKWAKPFFEDIEK